MGESKTTVLFRGMSIQTAVTITMGGLEILYFSIISRLLSKVDFGYFAAIMGVMSICMSLSEAGLGSAVIQKKDASKQHISSAFTLSIILGLICATALFLASPWIADLIADDTLVIPLRLMSSTIFLHSIISVGNAILYRNLNFKRIGFNSIIAYITSSCIAIAMAANGFGLYAVISAYIINSILLAILLYGFSVKIPSLGIDKKESKGIISFGGWLTAGVVLNNIGNQLDKLVLSKWLSVEALGSYNRPAGFVSSINTKIHSIFDTVLFPMLSDIQDDTKKVTNVFYRAVSLLNSFSVIFAAIFFFNAELIVTIFFGASWLDIVPIMQIGSIGVIFSIDHRLVDCFFRSLNYVKIGTRLRLLGVGVTLTSLYIGAQHGIIGVAWSILIANLILVLIKMITLAVKVKANIGSMFTTWLLAWKSAIIPIIVGGIYMFLPHTIISNIVFALIFGITIAIEFAFFPQLVGQEYQSSVYPYVEKIKDKILGKK